MQAGPPSRVRFTLAGWGELPGTDRMLRKLFAAPALLAAASLVAAPAAAAPLPSAPRLPVEVAQGYGPYVSIGWGGGWGWGRGYPHRHHRHRGSTAGDILAGVLILGTIAAAANAAAKANQRPRYPDRSPYPDRRYDPRLDGPRGLDGAADLCLREIERDARAREVTRVERNAGGWLVSGTMADGGLFNCWVGPDGRIDRLEVGGRSRSLTDADRQLDDDAYRTARANAQAEVGAGPQPAYPGGPLPGEDIEPESPET